MASDTSKFVAGHYTATWNAVALGKTEAGFSIQPSFNVEDVKIDEYGDTLVDGIYRGYNIRVSMRLAEFDTATIYGFLYPFDATAGTITDIGKTIVGSFAKPLVLTPKAGINSHNDTYTFPLTMPPSGPHGSFTLNNHLRVVDCNLLVYPNLSTGVLFTKVAGT